MLESLIEVLFFVLLVVVLVLVFFFLTAYSERKSLKSAEKTAASAKERLRIAERRYMQGKIKKAVFDSLVDDLEEELYSAELTLFRAKRSSAVSISGKTDAIFSQLGKPTKHRKVLIEKILKETELLREEMSALESKLLKREIKQSVFDKLIQKKENELIKKEQELAEIVAASKTSN